MPKACEHNIPETLKGVGPCQIESEVKKRNGTPNWWCKTHGMAASAPDGAALEQCPGSWFEPVPAERQLELDVADGELSIWGAIAPAIQIGHCPQERGGVHVHHRTRPDGTKDLDASFDIVRLRNGDCLVVVESMAAIAFSVSELAGQAVAALRCPKAGCGGWHIDEQKFATHPHSKHLCNSCGRHFRDRTPSISNPLADVYSLLGLERPSPPVLVDRPLHLDRTQFSAIAIWPSNSAIVRTSSQAEDAGIHVHAWDQTGQQVIDETYAPVYVDGEAIGHQPLRALAVQRALAHGAPIASMPCRACGNSLLSPSRGWIEPSTTHECARCGSDTKTRRNMFLNPLAEK